jgi:hypothetical protein
MYREFTATALLGLATSLAHADGPADWKAYAFSATKPQALMFYLNNEIVRTGDHVQVWMKALEVQKMDAVNASFVGSTKPGHTLQAETPSITKSIKLVEQGYSPPYASAVTLNTNQLHNIIVYEQVADEALIPATMKILYEIDCTKRLARGLSIQLPTIGDSKVRDWEPIPPESTIDILSKLTCKHRA